MDSPAMRDKGTSPKPFDNLSYFRDKVPNLARYRERCVEIIITHNSFPEGKVFLIFRLFFPVTPRGDAYPRG